VFDVLAQFEACTVSHRGVLLDVGDPTMRARMSGTKLRPATVEIREHEGASWARFSDRALTFTFVSPTDPVPESTLVVEARVRGGAGKALSVYLNGKALGTLPLSKGDIRVVSLRSAAGAALARGSNELLVKVLGGGRGTHDELAEIDWIRVGMADGDAPYSAPTRNDAITTVTLGGVGRRGISLRAEGATRCNAFIPNGASLEGFVGVTGGEGEAEVRVLVDRSPPRVVGTFKLGGEGAMAWQPLKLPLGDVGTLGSIELVAKASTKGARVVFGEPRIVAAPTAPGPRAPASRSLIVVVLGSLAPRMVTPYGGPLATPALQALADAGTQFDAHRASSTFANGAFASMVTGQLPLVHGVTDAEAELEPGQLTIAEAARQAGIATALFTANPTTTGAFGFGRGWETFAARSPTDEATALSVFDDAEKWLETHARDRFLLVVHARGGHPPWDVTSEELKGLLPTNYAGGLDPKHAGEMLARVRHGGGRGLTDADRQRASALYNNAIVAHDNALGTFVAHVKALGLEPTTTWLVTGDVGVNAGAHTPFIDDDMLDEEALAIPLVLRRPQRASVGHLTVPTASIDIARTALESLGLTPPEGLRGQSLLALIERGQNGSVEPQIAATSTRISARWGTFILSTTRERELKLCNVALEPACVTDVRATHPFAAEAMHALVFGHLERHGARPVTGPRATPDAAANAALRLWGIPRPKAP
jgi:hypothetical protein